MQNDMPRFGTRGPGHLVTFAMIALVLIAIGYWGITHRPIRRREGPLPPAVSVSLTEVASQQPNATAVVPTPTLSPNDVMVYTLDGQEVCSGYPLGHLGYNLRCGVPAGVHLFRVVDAAGESTLAVRYNEQVLVRVGPQ
ncbi:MAG: hypothetical protein ACE5LU_02575 [Anaerolineae bacterium]